MVYYWWFSRWKHDEWWCVEGGKVRTKEKRVEGLKMIVTASWRLADCERFVWWERWWRRFMVVGCYWSDFRLVVVMEDGGLRVRRWWSLKTVEKGEWMGFGDLKRKRIFPFSFSFSFFFPNHLWRERELLWDLWVGDPCERGWGCERVKMRCDACEERWETLSELSGLLWVGTSCLPMKYSWSFFYIFFYTFEYIHKNVNKIK